MGIKGSEDALNKIQRGREFTSVEVITSNLKLEHLQRSCPLRLEQHVQDVGTLFIRKAASTQERERGGGGGKGKGVIRGRVESVATTY